MGPGIPGWVDLGSPDLEAAKRFYGELFGWAAQVSPDPAYGGYTIFTRDGKPVAGAGPLFSDDQPTAWSTYVITDDAQAATTRVESAGGKVLVAPMPVGDQGRMAVFLDQAGAPISVWESGAMGGAELFNEPGSLSWTELTTRDPEGSKAFYGAVFGWAAKDRAYGPVTYTEWQVDGRAIAGMMPMVGDAWPPDLPPHWMVYFAVADVDASCARAAELGGGCLLLDHSTEPALTGAGWPAHRPATRRAQAAPATPRLPGRGFSRQLSRGASSAGAGAPRPPR